ncbi:hypothetical protein DLD99_01565 [Pseudomonas kribbensis]|uniref:Uncharacterized protein n=1 Tax=Pseudomonas kribbensis TaxID=1628086 RepID=A0A345RIU6_9PSED|nr:hypothetical protein [Pseudomonas kribbensis]AXI59212.1 hypothetical protein DLD99_01565 [Pseudomonas kribbensis]
MKNKMTDLRDHLFATLEALQDESKPMDIDRAKAIAEVGKVLVDSAKVEVLYLKVMDGEGQSTGFIESQKTLPLINGR